MSTVSLSSLSAPTMRSAVLIWPTRISTFVKSSMPIFSAGAATGAAAAPAAGVVAAGAGVGTAAGVGFSSSFAMDSILSIASVFSTRGNSAWNLPKVSPGVNCPQRRPSNCVAPIAVDWPSRCHTLVVLSGRTGWASTVTMRSSSAVVQRIVALRDSSSGEVPSAQGCSVVRYLSAAAITLQIVSRARANSNLS